MFDLSCIYLTWYFYGQNVCVAREPSGAFTGKLKKRGRREDFGHLGKLFVFHVWELGP